MFERVILITGMPRSGTSWLAQLFDSSPQVRFRLSPLFSYEFKNALDENSSGAQWRELLARAYRSESDFMAQKQRREAGHYPTFTDKLPAPPVLVIKDTRFHNLTRPMLERVPNLQVVALVRNPCGAIHSWLTAPREFPPSADPLAQWRHGQCRKTGFGEYWGFEDWKEVTRLHLALAREMPSRVVMQDYESLTLDVVAGLRRLFAFCAIPLGAGTEAFARRSQAEHQDNEYAVFKRPGTAQRWRRELQPQIRDEILADLRDTELARFAQ